MFDSIKDDLNSRLLISSKATTSEAQVGSNDVKYMTPLKVKQYKQGLISTGSAVATQSATQTFTIFNFSGATGKIKITGISQYNRSSNTYADLVVNGTSLEESRVTLTGSTAEEGYSRNQTSIKYRVTSSSGTIIQNALHGFFELEFDFDTKQFSGKVGTTNEQLQIIGYFNTLTTLTAELHDGYGTGGSPHTLINYSIEKLY